VLRVSANNAARSRPRLGARAGPFALAAVVVASLLLVSRAEAAPGDLTFDGCIGDAGSNGCLDAPGTPLERASQVAVSANGSSVYVTSFGSDSISHFTADSAGRLTFAECISNTGSGGCTDVPGTPLNGAGEIAISPDGASVYVASEESDSVTRFTADAAGRLAFADCTSNDGSGGVCAGFLAGPLDGAASVTISPGGGSVYVASAFADSISHFSVGTSGVLTYQSCLSNDGLGGVCSDVPGAPLDAPISAATSPDGDSLYVASGLSGSVSHFGIAPGGGQLNFAGCISSSGTGGFCEDAPGTTTLDSANEVTVSPDAASVYVTSGFSDSISHFSAAPAGQLNFAGCISSDGSGGFCADAPGSPLDFAVDVLVSPDGDSLYAAGFNSDAISRFSVAPAGQLTFQSCLGDGAGACGAVTANPFDGPNALALSPNGVSAYVAGFDADSISHLRREASPSVSDTLGPALELKARKVRAGRPVQVELSCDEACTVALSGLAKPKGGKRGSLGSKDAQLAAGQPVTLKLMPKGKLKRKLRRAGKGKASIEATATDAAGNATEATKKVKLT